ncbi:hypothetical protein GCM10027088_29750 [Nocardia goodfellowii]|uniref:Uncharacterized protein n=1 Tax=Nocardia goodfellowii TaxID=882446 RepID=A0ABS4Q968_9NOCA|nr:hypothetical protein [Nocardia goodfellowii]
MGAGSRVPGAEVADDPVSCDSPLAPVSHLTGVGAIMGFCVWHEVTLGVIDCIQMRTPSLLVGATADA